MLALILETSQVRSATSNLFLQFYLLTMNLQTLCATKSAPQTANVGKKQNQRTANFALEAKNNVAQQVIGKSKSVDDRDQQTAKKVHATKSLGTLHKSASFASLTSGMSAEGIYKEMRSLMPASKSFHVKAQFVFNLLVNFEQKARIFYEQKYAEFLQLTNVEAATQL